MNILKMAVSKLVTQANGDRKAEEIGVVDVPVFELSEFGLNVASTGTDEDGLPTYSDEKVQYVFDCIVQATKANARNKLAPKSVTLLPGNTIATTVGELIAKAAPSGEALKIAREFVTSVTEYLRANSGKSERIIATYSGLLAKKSSIPLASAACKSGLLFQLGEYEANSPDAKKYESQLAQAGELCSMEEIDEDEY